MSLYNKHRPTKLSQVFGQPAAVKILEGFKTIPKALLFVGPSGTGKTTLARIVAKKAGVVLDPDFKELNAADIRGIDTIRDIRDSMRISPLKGEYKAYLFDEAHSLTKDAQNAMLKLLEDGPSWVYWMLATTEPGKLLPTIKSRCTEIKTSLLNDDDSARLLETIAKKESFKLCKEVKEKLVEVGQGSPRKMLVILESILGIKDEDEQLDAIQNSDSQATMIELCRLLFNRGKWKDVATLLKSLFTEGGEEPETIRRVVLGYANAILLNSGKLEAFQAVEIFRDHVYDSGKAGITAQCYEFVMRK